MKKRTGFPRFLLLLALLTGLAGGFITPGLVDEPVSAAPLAANAITVVISEFRTTGPGGASDEFIEIYNPTNSSISLNGLKLRKSSGCNTTLSDIYTFTNISLSPGGYYLVTSQSYTGSVTPDIRLGTDMAIANNGGIAITSPALPAPGNTPIDRVGMCSTTTYIEGTNLDDITNTTGESYERKLGGFADSCQDNNNNAIDFQPINPSNPQNSSTPIRLCGGNADLRLTQTVNNLTPTKGDNITFTISVFNDGTDTARSVQVKDMLPLGLIYVSHVPSVGTYNSGTGIWDVGNLTNGGAATLDITANVANGDVKNNLAEVWYSYDLDPDSTPGNGLNVEDDNQSIQVAPLKVSGMSISMGVNNINPLVGSNVLFTITVSNPLGNPIDTTNVKVNAPLPVGLNYVSSTPAGSYNSGTGVWTIGDMVVGTTMSLNLTAKVVSSNQSIFSATVISDHYLDNTANIALKSHLSGEADLELSHGAVKLTNTAAQVILPITITNKGSDTATNVEVRDLLPSGLSFVSYNTTLGSYSSSNGIWSINSLASGNSATLNITVKVAGSGTSTRNFAEVWKSDQFDPNSIPGNGENGEDDNVSMEVPIVDLSLSESVNISGGVAIFTINVTNSGPDDASGVKVKTSLPSLLSSYSFVSFGSTDGNDYNTLGPGIWDVGNLVDGATETLVITTNVVGSLAANWVEVHASGQVDVDSVPNNMDKSKTEDDTASAPRADLYITQTVNNSVPDVNSNVIFTITVGNNGPAGTTNVEVKDVLPSGLTYVSYTSSYGTYSSSTGIWKADTLASGTVKTLNITAKVTTNGVKTNWAEVWKSNELDPDSTAGNGSTSEDDDASAVITTKRSIIINEVAWAGTASALKNDQWIELYNPSSSSINISGWKLTSVSGNINITLSGSISSGGYFLLERDDNLTVSDISADQIYAGAMSLSGEILTLSDGSGNPIDTANGNGGPWPAGSSSTYGTMERTSTSAENDSSWVTNTGFKRNGKNANGGNILGTPKNLNSKGAGPISTPTRTPIPTSTPIPPTPNIDHRLLINEILARPGFDWNEDGRTDVYDEFIEIKNVTPIDVTLSGWKIDNGIIKEADGRKVFTFPSNITLKPGERVVFYSSDSDFLLSDAGTIIRLLNPKNVVYDEFQYDIARVEDRSFCRIPDGGYSDEAWYEDCTPTPKLTNTREGSAPSMIGNYTSPVCNLPDSIPVDFFIAECRGYGANIWNDFFWDEFGWFDELKLPDPSSKWDSFIK